ncbi:MAG TPA: PAS domain S-box protein [Bacteroidales bacterium]|nr:PAS domain S-box protein [Bacteroidales bacterium]
MQAKLRADDKVEALRKEISWLRKENESLRNLLRNNEQRLQGILNDVAIGIIEVDSSMRITSMNDRSCEILGYKREELLEKSIPEITWHEDRERSNDLNNKLHNGDLDRFDYEKRYIKKSGEPLWVHVTVSAVRNSSGQHVGSVGTIEDISARKMYMEALKESEENLKARNEELTRFIYTVSHDLKSPLVTIKSFINYLMEDIENDDKQAQERDIKYIHSAADRMGRLLDELLQLSRIGRKEKPKSKARLSNIINTAIEHYALKIDEKKIEVQITGPEVLLNGHIERFIQLYQNLFDNAVKFMGEQPFPKIETGSFIDKENNEVVLFVRDNGKGIDPRHHHKIFGLFEKMDNGTDGTGIGLALVKRIVEVHGGTVWFTSEGIGKGTTFYFKLDGSEIIN